MYICSVCIGRALFRRCWHTPIIVLSYSRFTSVGRRPFSSDPLPAPLHSFLLTASVRLDLSAGLSARIYSIFLLQQNSFSRLVEQALSPRYCISYSCNCELVVKVHKSKHPRAYGRHGNNSCSLPHWSSALPIGGYGLENHMPSLNRDSIKMDIEWICNTLGATQP